MTARQLANLLTSSGMCWGDEDRAQPHRFSTPVVQEATPTPRLLQFPVSIGAAEPIGQYRRSCQSPMRVWVAAMLNAKYPNDEHAAWRIVTDLAVAQIGRALHGVELELITSAVRDVWNALEAQRMHTPGRMFR